MKPSEQSHRAPHLNDTSLKDLNFTYKSGSNSHAFTPCYTIQGGPKFKSILYRVYIQPDVIRDEEGGG